MGPFSQRYHVVAYSLRYHHPNPWVGDASDYSANVHSEDLAGVIMELGLAPAHVVGSSYGAEIALLLARHHPELVRSLVLGEPALFSWLEHIPGGASLFDEFVTKSWGPAEIASRNGDLEGGARLFINGVTGEDAFDQFPEALRRRAIDNARVLTLPRPRSSSTITREDARKIWTPTLLLTGDRSPKMFLLVSDELGSLKPNVDRATIPGVSHSLHGANPQAYNETVLAFLAEH